MIIKRTANSRVHPDSISQLLYRATKIIEPGINGLYNDRFSMIRLSSSDFLTLNRTKLGTSLKIIYR